MKNIVQEGFHYHSRCQKVKLIEIMFSDDLLIFAKGNVKSVHILAEKLVTILGLCISPSKSSIFMGRIKEEVQLEILKILNMPRGVFLSGI